VTPLRPSARSRRIAAPVVGSRGQPWRSFDWRCSSAPGRARAGVAVGGCGACEASADGAVATRWTARLAGAVALARAWACRQGAVPTRADPT
jgi:hypothetical protein